MLHKEAWVGKLLGTHLSIKVYKKVKFLRRDISSLAVKGLRNFGIETTTMFPLKKQISAGATIAI